MNRFSMEICGESLEFVNVNPSATVIHKIPDFQVNAKEIAKSLFFS
jgi:hypothetical protein